MSPVRKPGTKLAEKSNPSWKGVAWSSRIAVKLMAARPIIEPPTEIVWPIQSLMNPAFRQSPLK
jgi:hypothetical protein